MMDLTLSKAERCLIAATWNFRASAERSALRRFTRLYTELKETGAPDIVLEGVRDAIDDEHRHIGLCDALAQEFGWKGPPSDPTPFGPIGPKAAPLEARLLYEMVAFCCVTETINASMMLEINRRAIAPEVKETIHAILKDELNHSKVGWAYLQWSRDKGRGDWLQEWLIQMFYGAGVEEIYEPDTSGREAPHVQAYGELSFADRTEIFQAANRDVVLPGLERFGFDTSECRAWLRTFENRLQRNTA